MDTAIALWASNLPRIPILDWIMSFITNLDEGGFIWILIALILILFRQTRRVGITCLIALALVTVAGNFIIKPLIGRIRPYEALNLSLVIPPPGGYSFPSGHAGSSFAAATVLFIKFKYRGITAVIFAILVAFSRVFFTVHYLSDVLAGAILGVLCGIIALWITKPKLS